MNVSELIPARVRKAGYLTVVLLGVVLGAVTVGFATATGTVPLAVAVAQAVYGFLSANAVIVALFNLSAPLVVDGEEYPVLDESPADVPQRAATAETPRQFH